MESGRCRAAAQERRAKHVLISLLLRINPGKHSPVSSERLLEMDSLESHKEKRDRDGEKPPAPPRAARALAAEGPPQLSAFASHRPPGNFCSSSKGARKHSIPLNDSPASAPHQKTSSGSHSNCQISTSP